MVRTLIQLMRTLDKMPEEVIFSFPDVCIDLSSNSWDVFVFGHQTNCGIFISFQRTILMKLLYYDNITVGPVLN